ncbi:hypothetical protein K438DRAFT_2126497 [Mycena galopus ATCC 62051]|nr:hypothetical protein K438DRAFT_2126497 [Mycena galopus ATCC 62051]
MASLEPDTSVDRKPIVLPPGAQVPVGEYEAGRVICEVCGGGVSFRDDAGGGTFTLKHWEAHRLTWWVSSPRFCSRLLSLYADLNTHHGGGMYTPNGPPLKRRRAKRTEEERIEYLRADVHVAQFEAYRVLCASCDKWIRLRPNSTYCSIPWDAHRKSCLAKKSNAKNVYALEERNNAFAKDPDVRKFDPERVLCGMCDKWLSIPIDDHPAAVQVWFHHRSTCQKTHPHSQPHPSQRHPHPPSSHGPPHPHSLSHPPPPTHLPHPDAPHLLLDLSPTNYAAPHESRRRNAEQRAATLRADVLIREVEPNRVFCSLCTKWVQLRQDSSYCAYPWLQHRGKCLARYQRRAQKANEIASMKGGKRPAALASAEHTPVRPSEDGDEPESEEGVSAEPRRHAAQSSLRRHAHPPASHPPRAIPAGYAAASAPRPMSHNQWQQQQQQQQQHQHLADLDSPGGRRNFVFASVEYLFRTTYEASDDMSVSVLLTYLNAAMPTDKHEDFDTGEVVRAASALAAREKERYVLEGDMLRLLSHESG